MTDAALRGVSVDDQRRTGEKSPYRREYVGSLMTPLRAQAGAGKKHTLIGE